MKKLCWLFVCVLVIVVMTGCGRSKKREESSAFVIPEEGYTGEEVTITFYHTMGPNLNEVLERYIGEFHKLYPNISIEHFSLGDYDDVREQINQESGTLRELLDGLFGLDNIPNTLQAMAGLQLD